MWLKVFMKHYELLTVLPGTLAEDDLMPFVKKIKDILTENKATEIVIEDIGKVRLAYPMNHIRYGYYHNYQFVAPSESLPVIQEKLGLMRELLRKMINTYDPLLREHSIKAKAASVVRSAKYGKRREEPKEQRSVSRRKVMVAKEKKETPTAPAAPTTTPTPDMKMEDIDKKLDELLETDIKSI
jgi:small subunit ribosomal protein S6